MTSARHNSSEIAVFDVSRVILHNTFKTTTPLVETIVNRVTAKRAIEDVKGGTWEWGGGIWLLYSAD